jgi:hypothetical protein
MNNILYINNIANFSNRYFKIETPFTFNISQELPDLYYFMINKNIDENVIYNDQRGIYCIKANVPYNYRFNQINYVNEKDLILPETMISTPETNLDKA